MAMEALNTYRGGPDERGHFGLFGGRFVAETLMPLILAVEEAYEAAKKDPGYQAEIDDFAKHYVGRPSPLYLAQLLTETEPAARQAAEWVLALAEALPWDRSCPTAWTSPSSTLSSTT